MTENFNSEQSNDPIINQLEQSLIHFLSTKNDIESKVTGGLRRVRSLSVRINKNLKEPSFSVQIGIMESVFDAVHGLKLRGSCYGLERYIRDWFLRPTVNLEIKKYIFGNIKHVDND